MYGTWPNKNRISLYKTFPLLILFSKCLHILFYEHLIFLKHGSFIHFSPWNLSIYRIIIGLETFLPVILSVQQHCRLSQETLQFFTIVRLNMYLQKTGRTTLYRSTFPISMKNYKYVLNYITYELRSQPKVL